MSRNRFLLFLSLSFSFCSFHLLFVQHEPLATLGSWGSDHMSHMSAAILFFHRGLDVYRKPPTEIAHQIAGDTFQLPEREGRPVLHINWSDFPRPYPVGAFLYAAPEAYLYDHGILGLRGADLFALLKYLLCGHLFIWVLFQKRDWRRDFDSPLWWLFPPFVYLSVIFFCMTGFYDALPVLLLALCCIEVRAQFRFEVALVYFSAALFFHFRALWYLPLLLVIGRRGWAQRSRLRDWRVIGVVGIAAILLASSAISFICVRTWLSRFPASNPLLWRTAPDHLISFLLYCICVPLVIALLWQRGEALVVAIIAWQSFMLFLTPQTQWWHVLFLIPMLLLATVTTRPRTERFRASSLTVAFAFVLCQSFIAFRYNPFEAHLIQFVVRDWMST